VKAGDTDQPVAGLRDQLFANLNQRPETKDYGKSEQESDMIINSFRRESIPGGHLQQAHAVEEWRNLDNRSQDRAIVQREKDARNEVDRGDEKRVNRLELIDVTDIGRRK